MPKKLGAKLWQIREKLGMSQREIVKALKYHDTPLRASQIRNMRMESVSRL